MVRVTPAKAGRSVGSAPALVGHRRPALLLHVVGPGVLGQMAQFLHLLILCGVAADLNDAHRGQSLRDCILGHRHGHGPPVPPMTHRPQVKPTLVMGRSFYNSVTDRRDTRLTLVTRACRIPWRRRRRVTDAGCAL